MNKIMMFFKSLYKEIISNILYQSKTERIYWILISIFVIAFGFYLKMILLTLFISIIVILWGALVLRIDKAVVLMVAALFVTLGVSFVQNKNIQSQVTTQMASLEQQIEDFELSKKSYEITYRPYVGITKILVKKTEKKIDARLIIKNNGKVPANNFQSTLSQTISGFGSEAKTEVTTSSGIIFPESEIFHNFWLEGEKLQKFLESPNSLWEIKCTLTYDGIATSNHQTVYEAYYKKKTNNFGMLSGSAN